MIVTSALIDELGSVTDRLSENVAGSVWRPPGHRLGRTGHRAAIVALCVEAGFTPLVYTVDTGRLFPEPGPLRSIGEEIRFDD